jgi:lysozyme
MASAEGIDISSWQHPQGAPIDWEKVFADGKRFCIVKCSQGVNYVNPTFRSDIEGARGAGLLVGAYHFAEPYHNTAVAESAYALAAVDGVVLDLGLALDWEDLGSLQAPDTGTWAEAFLTAVGAHVHPSALYTSADFLNAMMGAPWGHQLWIADPSGNYIGPPPWMKQTGTGSVDGIEGTTDLDTLTNIRATNPGGGGPGAPSNPVPKPPGTPSAPKPAPEPSGPTEGNTDDVQVPTLTVTDPGPDTESPFVRTVQFLLAYKFGVGVGPTGPDGKYGPATEASVKAFQASHGLAEDGIVGPLTWEKLVG